VCIRSGLDGVSLSKFSSVNTNRVPQSVVHSLYRPETAIYSDHLPVFSSVIFGLYARVFRLYNCV